MHDTGLGTDPDARPPEALPEGIHTVVVGIGDQNGILRGKRVTAAHWPSVRRRGIALDNTFFAMDVLSSLVPNGYSGPDSGFPDLAVIPRGPLRPHPGEPGVVLCLGAAQERGGGPIPIDPRQPLLRAVAACRQAGFEPRLAAELEINLRHAPALEAADHALLLRGMVKQAARRVGLEATFMAKPFAEESGNGFHLHHSLWRDGRNVFAEGGRLSDLGRAYLGGLQGAMREGSLVGSTHPNAYRRRRRYSYAPTEPNWGVDNRTVALRVIEGEGPDDDDPVRVEERTAAADCNPYLLAAV